MKSYLVSHENENENEKGISAELQLFEQSFTYPLGHKYFRIAHGIKKQRYFDFFEQLGKWNTLILTQNGKITGVGCAVLREVKNSKRQRFWYLCDFKLEKHNRGKRVLFWLLVKYFWKFYIQAQSMVAINMSPPENNKLLRKVQRLFFFKHLHLAPLYFYQWSVDEYKQLNETFPSLFQDYALCTNTGIKDVVIEGQIQPIFHLVNRQHLTENLANCDSIVLAEIKEYICTKSNIVMLASIMQIENTFVTPSYVGSVISTKDVDLQDLRLSSLEI